ncbi:hypothetical protein BH18VER1_BH18VER1_00250 [soil metagenome]
MDRSRLGWWLVISVAALFLAACATGPSPATTSREAADAQAFAAAPTDRPGLGTQWGETRTSQVFGVQFRRARQTRPLATAKIHYNDAAGVRTMVGALDLQRKPPRLGGQLSGLLSVELRDESGRLLPGLSVGDRWFVVGEKGRRYSIVVRNQSEFQMEVVLSVDGLDVMDGRAASFRKRGYLLRPNGIVKVDGFRQSNEAVAAFRFSSVRDSYANLKHGDTRNVGVIGVAVFHEYGTNPLDMSEAGRRLRADPFPGRTFASPPEPIPSRPPRWR